MRLRDFGGARLSIAIVLLGHAAHAQAQTEQPAQQAGGKPSKDGDTVDAVTVTGDAKTGFRSSIDRRSYSVADDLTATAGSIGDALQHVPSVAVTTDGVVTLRGANVQFMIDGKPATLLNGPNGALAIQSMPADSIERIEVITTPGAELSPEGQAGVINLVTRQNHKIGDSGVLRAYAGPAGRAVAGLTLSHSDGKLTLGLDVTARRRDPQGAVGGFEQQFLDDQGAVQQRRQIIQDNWGLVDSTYSRLSAGYELDPRTTLSGEANYSVIDYDRRILQHVTDSAPDSSVLDHFDVDLPFGGAIRTGSLRTTLRRALDNQGRTLTLDLSRDDTHSPAYRTVIEGALGASPPIVLDARQDDRAILTQFKADYVRPLPSIGGELKAGYALRVDDNRYGVVGRNGTSGADLRPDPSQTNTFNFNQTVHAAYVSYQRPFSKWTALGGLRLEDTRFDLGGTTPAPGQDYVKLYPSLRLTDALDDRNQLSFSYSERIDRPAPSDLNPFVVVNGITLSAGNAALKPQYTDSFEAAYQYKHGQTYYLATLFYRDSHDGVGSYTQRLADGRLFSQRGNIADTARTGLELAASGRLAQHLTYNLSGTWLWADLDANLSAFTGVVDASARRKGGALGGQASLTWEATAKDTLQINAQRNGRTLRLDGEQRPSAYASLGYRHRFDDHLSGFVTAQDVFNSRREAWTLDTPAVRSRADFEVDSRTVWLGLTWTFSKGSAARPQDPGFQY